MSVQEVLKILNTHTQKFDSIKTGQTNIEQKIQHVENVLTTQNDDIVENKNCIIENKNEIDNLKILVKNLEKTVKANEGTLADLRRRVNRR